MDASAIAPTDEQIYNLDLVVSTTGNIQFVALAGTGKTYMLDLIQRQLPPPVLALAFNTGAQKTMESRFLTTTKSQTINSFGLTVWNDAVGKRCIIEKEGDRVVKTSNSFRRAIERFPRPAQTEAWDSYSDIKTAVDLAKALGYVPQRWRSTSRGLITSDDFWRRVEVHSDIVIDLTEEILSDSIQTAYGGNIDFNDQCYMPALFGGSWPHYPTVLIDEDQDQNPINIEMLRHLKASRLIAVGDPWQSIYAFRGAMQDGMRIQKEKFNMQSATLSVSFRCPEAIVELARWRAPNFKWIKPGGYVGRCENPTYSTFPDGCVILCRNNAPLFRLALRLLSHGRSVSVGGSDIGPKIVGMLKKLAPKNIHPSEISSSRALTKVDGWEYERTALGSTTAQDTADCMRVFLRAGRTLADAITFASDILKRKGTIILSTGHKAKGLEWPIVYHLDPHLIRDGDQENNLRYVIQTRSMDQYWELDSQEIGE